MTPTGLEHTPDSPRKKGVCPTEGAEYGALTAAARDPDFLALAVLWPNLAPEARAAILALAGGVGASASGGSDPKPAEKRGAFRLAPGSKHFSCEAEV